MVTSPFFIVGCGRSGTTLLRLMMDSHPSLAVPPESHFIPSIWKRRTEYLSDEGLDVARLVRDISSHPRVQEWNLREDKLQSRICSLHQPSFADVVEAFFISYADCVGKPRWGDKTPHYVRHVELIGSLFPQSKFIHVVRDGRDVALSFLDVNWGPTTVHEAAEYWRKRIVAGFSAGGHLTSQRLRTVRYEDLLDDPEVTLSGVCRFIGTDYDYNMLRFNEKSTSSIPRHRQGWHSNLTGPLARGLRDWRREMSHRNIATFERIAGRELSLLGYPLVTRNRPPRNRIPTARKVLHRVAGRLRNGMGPS